MGGGGFNDKNQRIEPSPLFRFYAYLVKGRVANSGLLNGCIQLYLGATNQQAWLLPWADLLKHQMWPLSQSDLLQVASPFLY